MRFLILCTGNSARSQMAEGLLRHLSGGGVHVESAGTRPGVVRAEAIAVLEEMGIDISSHRSKSIEEFREEEFDHVLTVCDSAKEECPWFPAGASVVNRSFPDPASHEGDLDERLAAFRAVRDEIRAYLEEEYLPLVGFNR